MILKEFLSCVEPNYSARLSNVLTAVDDDCKCAESIADDYTLERTLKLRNRADVQP